MLCQRGEEEEEKAIATTEPYSTFKWQLYFYGFAQCSMRAHFFFCCFLSQPRDHQSEKKRTLFQCFVILACAFSPLIAVSMKNCSNFHGIHTKRKVKSVCIKSVQTQSLTQSLPFIVEQGIYNHRLLYVKIKLTHSFDAQEKRKESKERRKEKQKEKISQHHE